MATKRECVVFIPERAWVHASTDPEFNGSKVPGWAEAVRQRRGAGWSRMVTTTPAGIAHLVDVFDGYVLGVSDNYLRTAVTMAAWRLRRVAEGKAAGA